MEKYVDLHVHSTASDGTLTPSQLVSLAEEKNLNHKTSFPLKSIFTKPTANNPIKIAVSKNNSTTTLFTTPKVKSMEKLSTDNTIKHI